MESSSSIQKISNALFYAFCLRGLKIGTYFATVASLTLTQFVATLQFHAKGGIGAILSC